MVVGGDPGPVGMTVCRGCCCGDPARDPSLDHEAQLARLRRFVADRPGRVALRVSDCLGPCSQANVVVVRPAPAARRRGARPVWLALVRDGGSLDDLEGWVAAGGPGVAALPDTLALHVFTPPAP
jgi:hypothetical protein